LFVKPGGPPPPPQKSPKAIFEGAGGRGFYEQPRGKREKRKGKDKIYMGKASPPSPNLKLIKIQS